MDTDGLIALLVKLLCVTVEHNYLFTVNDAQCYWNLRRVGHGRARLLAEGDFAARVPLMAPARISRNHRQRQASQTFRSIRMLIELLIGVHKFHASINSIFMHKRCFLPFVVCTCGNMSNRRMLIICRLTEIFEEWIMQIFWNCWFTDTKNPMILCKWTNRVAGTMLTKKRLGKTGSLFALSSGSTSHKNEWISIARKNGANFR